MRFAGKRVLITGASKGLGCVAAAAFANQGARLVLAGRNRERLSALRATLAAPGAGGEHEIFDGDLTDPGAALALADMVNADDALVDIILHAMGGGYAFHDPLPTWAQIETLHRVNLGAAAELNRLLIPGMIDHGAGRVIHVGSTASSEACGAVGYNTVKAALAGYVRSLGREMAGHGVVVTGILPGAFTAPGNAFERRTSEQVQDFIDRRLPRGRVGTAEEIIPLIFLLASDDASMMAGSCVAIDAGETTAYRSA